MEGTNSHDGAGNPQAGPHAAGLDGGADHRPGAARDASASPLAPVAGAAATQAARGWPTADGEEAAGRTYAALDLGTNNCRLLVARPSRRGFKVVDAFSRIIRLGEGVSATGGCRSRPSSAPSTRCAYARPRWTATRWSGPG